MTQNNDNRRREPRLALRRRAYIRVLLGSGTALGTVTEDISASGFSALFDRAIDAGVILHVVIEQGEPPQRYLLAAEVRWCRADADQFRAGFALLDAEGSDFARWQEAQPDESAQY